MGFASDYFAAMNAARRPVQEASVRAFASMSTTVFVPRWYVMQFQIIRATEPVLLYARSSEHGDGALDDFFQKKLEEESGHDGLLLADLELAGVPGNIAKQALLNPFVAEMVGRQYYLIDFVGPAAYLGYIGLLEGFPPTLEQIDAIQAASGLPAEAFSCARVHAKADVGHREELAKVLDEVPAKFRRHIVENGARCAALQCAALDHLSQQGEFPWTS